MIGEAIFEHISSIPEGTVFTNWDVYENLVKKTTCARSTICSRWAIAYPILVGAKIIEYVNGNCYIYIKCTPSKEEEALFEKMKCSIDNETAYDLGKLNWKDLFSLVYQKNEHVIEAFNNKDTRDIFLQQLEQKTDEYRKQLEQYEKVKEEIIEAERKMTFSYFYLNEDKKK